MNREQINKLLGEKNKIIDFNKKTKLVSPVDVKSVEAERDSLFQRGKKLLGFSESQPINQPISPPVPVITPIPSTPKNLVKTFETASKERNIPVNLLTAQAHQESMAFNPKVISGEIKSPAGATGISQFMPNAIEELKRVGYPEFDPNDPYQAIPAQAFYMRLIADRTTGGDLEEALKAYNAGEGNYKKYGKDMDFPETKKYVQRIKDLRK